MSDQPASTSAMSDQPASARPGLGDSPTHDHPIHGMTYVGGIFNNYMPSASPYTEPLTPAEILDIRTGAQQWLVSCQASGNEAYLAQNRDRCREICEFVQLPDEQIQAWASEYQVQFARFCNYPIDHSDVHVRSTVGVVVPSRNVTTVEVPDDSSAVTASLFETVPTGQRVVMHQMGHSFNGLIVLDCARAFTLRWSIGVPLQALRDPHGSAASVSGAASGPPHSLDRWVYIPVARRQCRQHATSRPSAGFSVAHLPGHTMAVRIDDAPQDLGPGYHCMCALPGYADYLRTVEARQPCECPCHRDVVADVLPDRVYVSTMGVIAHPRFAGPVERWQQSWNTPEFPLPDLSRLLQSMSVSM